jgi:hypothetical protein
MHVSAKVCPAGCLNRLFVRFCLTFGVRKGQGRRIRNRTRKARRRKRKKRKGRMTRIRG